jgi:RNA polymerase sigma-70 factor (ECF subfamily)
MTTSFKSLPNEMQLEQEHEDNIPLNVNINVGLAGLLTQCQQGDKVAFSGLYQQTSARLNGIAYRITRNVDSANEVLQEAFIQIWQNCEQYQSAKSEPFTWLASIVRYRAYDRLRYDKRRRQQDMVEWDDDDDHSSINLEELNRYSHQLGVDTQSEHALHGCLAKLEQKQSQSILMAYLYGYSREDISSYFDTPINTIKSWIRRGLGRLQQCLNQ